MNISIYSIFVLLSTYSALVSAGSDVLETKRAQPKTVHGVSASELEGSQYQIFLGVATASAREILKNGEIITLKNVKFEQYGKYFSLIPYDASGKAISDKRYALTDLGILDERLMEIDRSVNQEKVEAPRGEIIHGNPLGKWQDSNPVVFKSAVGGTLNVAYQVVAPRGSINFLRPKNSVGFSCDSSSGFSGDVIFRKPLRVEKDDIELIVSFPGDLQYSLKAKITEVDTARFGVTADLLNAFTEAEAVEIQANDAASLRFGFLAYGMKEALLRLKNQCEQK